MGKEGKVSKKILFAWPTRSIAIGVMATLMGYVTYYATDFMGLSAGTVGVIFLISRIFDGFTDLAAGFIIDRTHTKWGKGRPYELALIGYMLSMVLLFSAPKMGVTAGQIYLFVMYSLANSIFLTLLNCNESVHLANALEKPEQSVTILAFNGFIGLVFTMASAILLPQLANTIGQTQQGWIMISIGLAIPLTLFGLIRMFLVKERTDIGTVEKVTLKQMISLIAKNKYILIFSLIILVGNMGTALVQNGGIYYFKYIIGDLGVQSLMSLSMLAIIIVVVLMPALSKKFGFVNVLRVTTILGLIGYLIRLISLQNIALLFVSNILSTMGFTTVFSFAGTFIIDCMDYGEWKNGVRTEGATACVQSVTAKIGTAFGAGAIGIMMGMAGYVGGAKVQVDSANTMIIVLYSVIPALFCVLQFILLRIYDLDKLLPEIRAQLKEKRAR